MNTPPPLGIIYGESHADYHGNNCIGAHDLDDLNPYPILFRKRHVTREIPAKPETDALRFGRILHTLALEGEAAFAARYVIVPEDAPTKPQARWINAKKPSEATLKNHAWWQKFEADNAGKEVADQSDVDMAWRMVEAIREKPGVAALFDPAKGKPEVTFRHKMAAYTLQCRADWYMEKLPGFDYPAIIDIKSVASLADFDSQFEDLNYYRHAAFYRLVANKVLGIPHEREGVTFVYVAVEKAEPWQVAVRIPDSASVAIGTNEVMRDLDRLKRCFETGHWPGEPDEMRPVSLKEWTIKRKAAA